MSEDIGDSGNQDVQMSEMNGGGTMEEVDVKREPETTEPSEVHHKEHHEYHGPTLDESTTCMDDTAPCCKAFWCGWLTDMCGEKSEEDEHKPWMIHAYGAKYPLLCYLLFGCGTFVLTIILLFVVLAAMPLNNTTDFPFYILDHRTTKRQDGTNYARDECTAAIGGSAETRTRATGVYSDGDLMMTILYVSQNGDSLFTKEDLERIQEFEAEITGNEKYTDEMCRLKYNPYNQDQNLGCERMETILNFFAAQEPVAPEDDWNDLTNPYFPQSYTNYPSWLNSGLFYYCGYNQTSRTFTTDLSDEDNIEYQSKWWAAYGQDITFANWDEPNPEPFQYIDWQVCQLQIDYCIDSMNNSPYGEDGTCTNDEDLIQTVMTENNIQPGDDNYVVDCDDLVLNALPANGVGCDDSLDAFGVSQFQPGTTARDVCCQSCFELWFPDTNVYGEPLDPTTCAGWGAEPTEDNTSQDIAYSVFKGLETCIDYNLGEYSNTVLFTTSDVVADSSSFEDQVKDTLLANGVDIKLSNWGEDATYEIDCSVNNNEVTCDIEFPWNTQQSEGVYIIEADYFRTQLSENLGEDLDVESITVTGSTTTSPRSELTIYTISSPPIYGAVDGNYGGSADMDQAKESVAFKSHVYFGIPLNDYEDTADREDGQVSQLGEWAFNEFQDHLDGGIKGIDVYWQFYPMEEFFINSKLGGDMAKVMATIIFIWLYMVYSTNSWFLACNGMFMIFMNFGPSILLYRLIANFKYFGILQQVSIFIILSIGADDIFVIIDTWAQVNTQHWKDQSLEHRMTHCLGHSGKVMLTTSLSTTFSFLANATSSIPAIYTFGVFCAFLIVVNYTAVCLFYPTVLTVYELYFMDERTECSENGCNTITDGCDNTCGCSVDCRPLIGCGCPRKEPEDMKKRYERWERLANESKEKKEENRDETDMKNIEMGKRIPDANELRAIDEWFGESYYKNFIHTWKIIIIIVFLAIFIAFFTQFMQLKPDPDPPNIYPEGYNYGVFNYRFANYFSRSVGDLSVFTWIVFGLLPNGIDRSGTDPTDTEDLGEPKYDPEFNFFGADQMEYLCALCEDISTGARYGDLEDRLVMPETIGSAPAVMCPFIDFRNWIWSDTPNANWLIDIGMNPQTINFVDPIIKECIIEEYGEDIPDAFHTPQTWPIQGFWNNWQRFGDWFLSEMSPETYGYVAGTPNSVYYSENLWYTLDNWADTIPESASTCSRNADYEFTGTPKFLQINVQLSALSNLDYDKGIELYESWEKWLKKWGSGEIGTSQVYTPTSTHCDGLSANDCNDKDGCGWNSQNAECRILDRDYPGEKPVGLTSAFVCDEGVFSYYYLQEQVVMECLTGIFIAIVLAFLVLNWATGNWFIATLSTVIITMVVIIVMGFTVSLGWKLGMLETVVYVMVVGMAVDYVVHLAESYLDSSADSREERTQMMLKVRAFSVLSGAISTLGGVFILFFAFITFFQKFGTVIFFLIFTSLLYSMIFFAALLDAMGPEGHYGDWSEVIKDAKHAWITVDPNFGCVDCLYNCLVPHNSKHYSRKDRIDTTVKAAEDQEQ